MTSQELRASPLGTLALVVSVATLLFVLWTWRTHDAPATMPSEVRDASHRERMARLSDHFEELKLEVQHLAAAVAAKSASEGRQPAVPGPDVDRKLRELETRMAKADAGLAEVQRDVASRRAAQTTSDARDAALERSRVPSPPAPTTAEIKERIAESTRRCLDAALPEEERLKGLRALRGLGEGARSGAVATAMVDLAATSQDPKVRADVWRQMHGARDPALVQPLLTALAQDLDENVRDEAAETLDDFVDRPEVRQALERALQGDASAKVRRRAEQSLSRKR